MVVDLYQFDSVLVEPGLVRFRVWKSESNLLVFVRLAILSHKYSSEVLLYPIQHTLYIKGFILCLSNFKSSICTTSNSRFLSILISGRGRLV